MTMQAHTPARTRSDRQRGSTLLLVIAALILSMFAGLMLIEIVRKDRQSTINAARAAASDQVVSATYGRIVYLLKEDLGINNGGTVGNPNDDTFFNGQEYFDHAGPSDPHLASTYPRESNLTYPQITRLGNAFTQDNSQTNLVAADAATAAYSGGAPAAISGNSKADADGDGIIDAKWEPAPIATLRGWDYYIAARVIDLGSLININAATIYTTDAATPGNAFKGWGSGANGPRTYYTTCSDVSRVAKLRSGAAWPGVDKAGVLKWMDHRGLPQSAPTPIGMSADISNPAEITTVRSAWYNNVAYYDSTAKRFLIDNELELRYRGGLNNFDVETKAEELAPETLLNDDTSTTYGDLPGNPDIRTFLYGGASGANYSNRSFPTIRHMLTTINGAAMFAPQTVVGSALYQYDLTWGDGGSTNGNITRADNIRRIVARVLKHGAPKYKSLTDADIDLIAAAFAVNLVDYTDADNVPTKLIADSGEIVYGQEKLPYLREVYAQFTYENTESTTTPGTYDTYTLHPDSGAIAIELGNPYDSPIDLATTKVRLVVNRGTADERIYELTANSIAARDDSTVEDVHVVVSNTTSALSDGSSGEAGADLVAGLVLTAARTTDAGAGVLRPVHGATNTIELQVETADGWISYDRMAIDLSGVLPTYGPIIPANTPDPIHAHYQTSFARICDKLKYLSNKDNATLGSRTPDVAGYLSTLDKLEVDAKGLSGGTAELDPFQLHLPNRDIYSLAELGLLLTISYHTDGGTAVTLSEQFETLADDRWSLDFAAPSPAGIGVPHAALLLDYFINSGVTQDGRDNDNDGLTDVGGGDLNEHFIAGKMNVNTLSALVGASVLPEPVIANSAQKLFAAIDDYRENRNNARDTLTGADGNWRTDKGVVSVGELLGINPGSGASPTDMAVFGTINHSTLDPDGDGYFEADWYPTPEDVNSRSHVRLDITGDREGLLARFHHIANLFSVRSDVYAAYVVVRGYEGGTTTNPQVERRFVAIIDRSNVGSDEDTPRILGIFEY